MTPSALLEEIKQLVGAERLLTSLERASYLVDGLTPDAVVFPRSVDEVSQIMALASEEGVAVTPWGGGTKLSIGGTPARVQLVLALARLNRLIEHAPGDLTATCEAGIIFDEFQRALGSERQWLSLDPAFGERATVGGILSTNASGPKRHLYGTARDLVIGIEVVAADGTLVHGGGKVVKNVAGYDLPKLYIGALGSLGIIVGVTVKLRPLPEDDRALLAIFPGLEEAHTAVRSIAASDLIPNAIELLNPDALRPLASQAVDDKTACAAVIGFDGLPEQVSWQLAEASRLVEAHGASMSRELAGGAKESVWQCVREIGQRAYADPVVQLRLVALPSQVAAIFREAALMAAQHGQRIALSAHAGEGVITAALATEARASGAARLVETVAALREMVRGVGGQLTIERAPIGVKEKLSVWDPPDAAVRIMARIKAELDPKGILNPGRFFGGL